MKRDVYAWIGVVLALLWIALFALRIGSTPASQDSSAPASKTSPAVPVVTPTVLPPAKKQPPTVRWYVVGEPLPASFLETWQEQAQARVQQFVIKPTEPFPADGDLYSLEPRWLPKLKALLTLKPNALAPEWLTKVNPLFLGHAFDSDNQFVIPWRWGVWLNVQKVPQVDAPTPSIHQEAQARNAVEILTTLQLKTARTSVNQPRSTAWTQAFEQVEKTANFPTVEKTLQAVVDAQSTSALVPSHLVLTLDNEKLNTLSWSIPKQGTIIHLELLALPAESKNAELATSLAQWLIAPEQQARLTETLGYFPAFYRGEKPASPRKPLPDGEWLNQSEILLHTATSPTPLPTTPSADEAGTASSALPSPLSNPPAAE